MRAADVKSLLVRTSDGATVKLQRNLDRWIAPSHGGRDVPGNAVEGLLDAVTGLRATSIQLLDVYPADQEVATVRLIGFDQRPRDTVRIVRSADGTWGMDNGDDVLRIYPPALAIPLSAADFGLPTSP